MDIKFSIFNIELTNHCIMKCIMCPRTNNMTRGLGYMDYSLFMKAIDEIHDVNPTMNGADTLWLHHFGESLLHPEFDRFIAYASTRNIRTGISVNPIMLTEDVSRRLLCSGLGVCYISLDGHDDESFFRIRGMRNAYGKSKDRLLDFLRIKASIASAPEIILSMIDFNANRESIEISRQYWESMEGIDRFLPKSFTAWDGSAADVNSLAEYDASADQDRSVVQCRWPFERMTILWDGTVVPCCFDYNQKYALGNLALSPLSEIWDGEPMRRLRAEFAANRVLNPLCRSCERLYLPADRVAL